MSCLESHKLLSNLKTHKSTGPDSIPAYVLKSAADQLAPIADFIDLKYFSGFSSGLKSHVLISHDYLNQLNLFHYHETEQPCARGKHQNNKRNSVCKQTGLYLLHAK